MQWNKIPDTFEGEEIVEQVGLYVKTTNEDDYTHIKHIDVS